MMLLCLCGRAFVILYCCCNARQ